MAAQGTTAQTLNNEPLGRDPKQQIDAGYTQRIQKYTTDPALNSPLTNYLPASSSVPNPAKVLGDIAGAPNMLPYAEDVYKYFRMLAASTPRVQVFTIGHTEEGREMIAAAIGDASLLKQAKENSARLAKLADPRTIQMNDATAQSLISQSFPVYYITGTIHSVETGAPTALMELAYRLAVDESPYIQYIRSHMIVLITPVVEVDGRDRMVDIYRWHLAHPGEQWPHLLYWGHYVAHDNNRDAMGMTLALTNNVLNTFLGWHAQVLHDLHESVPFLYDNTVGDGPYNAWIDPILNDEWAALGWNNVGQMENLGMPGVFTHGNFDTWSPGYLMFLAALHNGISRLYETFGNGGADTEKRILTPEEYARTWYKTNPPYPTVVWSQRDNNNYEETALLTTLSYFSHNTTRFLTNYYRKSKRSIEKPQEAGPAAYVLPAGASSWNRQAQLLKVLSAQHVEISKLDEQTTLEIPVPAKPHEDAEDPAPSKKTKNETFPAGSYVVRMDQPYSRIADALLDRQFWSPEDPQKHPYDDTGWSFGDLFNVKTVRVPQAAFLSSRMHRVTDIQAEQPAVKAASVYVIQNDRQSTLAALAYAAKSAQVSIADEKFDSGGKHYGPGTLLVSGASGLDDALAKLNLTPVGIDSLPNVKSHAINRPRIAVMHTWLYTQGEGWWRMALDKAGVPYDYISTQTAAKEADLRSKYDVIVFAPVGVGASTIVSGMPMYRNPIPWEKSDLTPNLGRLDSTPDMRPGLGFDGLAHLKAFVEAGGLLITAQDTAQFAIENGLAPGVSVVPHGDLELTGSVLRSEFVETDHPVAYGYSGDLGVYSENGMAFNISDTTRPTRHLETAKDAKRPTGRGGPEEDDVPEARPLHPAPELPNPKPWQATPLNEEQARNNPFLIPVQDRPDVVLRFADNKDLLLSGLLEGGSAIAERAVVIDAHLGSGNVLLFAINPMYRGETIGSYPMVLNAILNWDHLGKHRTQYDATLPAD